MIEKLKRIEGFSPRKGPVLLIIMDGVGIGKQDESDGVFVANTPVLDSLMKKDLSAVLQAHGTAVGMPSDDDMGNSEVGHNALGAGRVFAQGASLVNNSINSKDIFQSDTWNKIVGQVSAKDSTLHFLGLLSDGNVHSNIRHLLALVEEAAQSGIKRVRIHMLTDGRDVYERSALTYVDRLEKLLNQLNSDKGVDYRIASGGGRMITTMDRYEADWNIVKKGWDTHVLGKARQFGSATEAIQTYYDEDPQVNDQFLESFVIADAGKPIGTIEDDDAVICINFRGDRAIEISIAFEAGPEFNKFARERVPNVFYAGMMEYDGDTHVPKNYLVTPPQIDLSVSEFMCNEGITSFAISETQKFGHVTYFWNGNKSGYVCEESEKFVEIPSDKIQFQHAPKMKAYEITEKTIELLQSGNFKFGRLNFANGDMVGHTGVEASIITAVETVDECVGKLIDVVKQLNGIVVITADHGNADEMFTVKNGKKIVSTAHSLNKVPFIIVDSAYNGEYKMAELEKTGLSNVASTVLNLLGYEKPEIYDPSLITFN